MTSGPATPARTTRAAVALTAVVVTAAVLGPVLLRRGYVLSYDMVFVPDPPLSARVLGLDGSAPRAVPSDLVVVLLSRLAEADLVQKALLCAVLLLASAGAGRLAARVGAGRAGGVVAAVVYPWSPFLAERLVLGHWALLLGFAVLPWVLAAVGDAVEALRRGDPARRPLAASVAWTVPAAAGGGNAVVLVVPAVLAALVAARAVRRTLPYPACVVLLSLPWVVPAVLRPGGLPTDPAGVDAFAARADGPLGVLGSLVTLGGIWNAGVVPTERGSLLLALVTLAAVVASLVAGLPLLLRHPRGPALGAAGVCGLALAVFATTPPGAAAVRFAVVTVPGAGLLRDGQKFLAAWVLLVAVCAGLAARRALGAAARLRLGPVVAAGSVALPVLLLPGLAWGAAGRLQPVAYPEDWGQVRAALDRDPEPGAVVVLPWGPYRTFEWNAGRVVLDPVQRITGRTVVQDDDLPLRDRRVAGEDPRARQVSALLAGGGELTGPLRREGYRYVVVHRSAPGADAAVGRLAGAPCVVCSPGVSLYALAPGSLAAGEPAAGDGPTAARPPAPWVVAGLFLSLLTAAGSVAVAAGGAGWRTGPNPGTAPGAAARGPTPASVRAMLRITALRGRPAEPGDRPGRRDDDRGASNAPLAALVAGLVGGLLAVVSGVALPRALAPQESPLSPEQSQVVNYDQ